MLTTNLQSSSIKTALTKTFDGDHPCRMCNRIAAGKQEEKKADLPLQIKKLEFIAEQPAFIFVAPRDFDFAPVVTLSLAGLTYQPAVPPPRASA